MWVLDFFLGLGFDFLSTYCSSPAPHSGFTSRIEQKLRWQAILDNDDDDDWAVATLTPARYVSSPSVIVSLGWIWWLGVSDKPGLSIYISF